jgi:hypothetical protein
MLIASLIYRVTLAMMRSLSSYADIRRLISTVVGVVELIEKRNAACYESLDDWGYVSGFRLRLKITVEVVFGASRSIVRKNDRSRAIEKTISTYGRFGPVDLLCGRPPRRSGSRRILFARMR